MARRPAGGFVALKQLDARHGELKSMRAAPEARGTGVGRALLNHVIAEATMRGYDRLSLETGTADLHAPAVALYRSAGFIDTGAFADYRPSPHNQFLTLDLREILMPTLVLIRHGQSSWNLENRFTGWWDVDVTEKGVGEARAAGRLMKEKGAGFRPDLHLAAIARDQDAATSRWRKWAACGCRSRRTGG